MASPNRLKGYGTQLAYATSISGGNTLVSPVTLTGNAKVKFPAVKRAITNTFDLLTTGELTSQAQVKTSQAGWLDLDKVDVTGYFLQSLFSGLLSLLESGNEVYFQATLPLAAGQSVSGATLTWPGFLSEIGVDEINIDDDNLVMVPFSIKCNDVVYFTSGS